VLTLLAGWSNDPDLERPGAKPGYGHELPPEPESGQLSEPASGQLSEPESDFSSGLPAAPDRTAEPAPPVPGQAGPPRG
jgi:hypothetical protein